MKKINSVYIKNYRQFIETSLEFKDDHGIFLFVAQNGSGKTNFLNAICWCLYEEEPFIFRDNSQHSYILNESVAKAKPYEEIQVSLEVQIDKNVYLFNRTLRETQQSYLTVKMKSGEDWIPIAEPNILVESFLPRALRDFFIFDGESVDSLFEGDYSKKLKNSVWKVSNIEIIDNGIEHLNKVKEAISKRIGSENVNVDEKQNLLNDLKDKINTLNNEIDIKRKEVQRATVNRKMYRDKADSLKRFKEITMRRDTLEVQLHEYHEQIDKLDIQISNILVNEGIFVFLKEPLRRSIEVINRTRQKGELPAPVRADFINDLIESHKNCICGRPITEKEIETLQSLLEKNITIDEKQFLIEERIKFNSFLESSDKIIERLREYEISKIEFAQKVEKVTRELNEIKLQLIESDDVEMKEIEETITRLDEMIESTKLEISRSEDFLKSYENESTEVNKELLEAIEQDKKNYEEAKKVQFIESSLAQLESVRDRVIDRVRRAVSNNANNYFKETIWKKNTYEKVEFEDGYEVKVLKKNQSNNQLKNLGTGERKVLGFSTIKALTTISGFSDVPVFIDGALAYLDDDTQEKFLNTLPDFLPNKQLFIFSPSGKDVEQFAQKFIREGNYYHLILDEEDNSTKIVLANYNG